MEVPATAAVDGTVKWKRAPSLGRQPGGKRCLLMGTHPPCSWVHSLVSQQCRQAFFLQMLGIFEQCTNHATACDSPVQTASHSPSLSQHWLISQTREIHPAPGESAR